MENQAVKIFLIGEADDTQLAEEIIGSLKEKYHIVYNDGKNSIHYNAKSLKTALICETSSTADTENSVIIIKNSAEPRNIMRLNPSNTVIIDFENEELKKHLYLNRLSALVCGLSEKDAVTFSSREQGSCLVSLQREVSLNGKLIEPQEVKIKSVCKNKYPILAAGAVKIIIGCLFDG